MGRRRTLAFFWPSHQPISAGPHTIVAAGLLTSLLTQLCQYDTKFALRSVWEPLAMDLFVQVIYGSWGTHESDLFDTFDSLHDYDDERLRGRFSDKRSFDDHFRLAV